MREFWINVAKWGWWLAVLIFILLFLRNHSERVAQVLGAFPAATLVVATGAILAGKTMLVLLMRAAMTRVGAPLGFPVCFRVYHLTQLGKYIPGGIWQFVGRIGYYRRLGLAPAAIRDGLLLETFWLAASAMLIGLILVATTRAGLLAELYAGIAFDWIWLAVPAFAALPLIVLIDRFRPRLQTLLGRLAPSLATLAHMSVLWCGMGLAFWLTLPGEVGNWPALPYVVGLYALAFAIGFMVPFAPAGLGVREAVLVFGLSPFMTTEVAIILAALNRVLYVAAELLLATLALAWRDVDHQTEFNSPR